MFEIEKMKDGTYTSRERVNGKITRSNSDVNTLQSAYKTIIGWVKRDVKRVGIKNPSIRKSSRSNVLFTNVSIGDCAINSTINVKEINC